MASADRLAHLEQCIESLVATLQGNAIVRGANAELDVDSSETSSPEVDGLDRFSRLANEEVSPPLHLQLLFDNSLVRSKESSAQMPRLSDVKCPQNLLESARARLRSLVPLRGEVASIDKWSAHWLGLYHAISPPASTGGHGDDLLKQYDTLNNESSPTDIALLLLNLAFVAQQVPPGHQPRLSGWQSIEMWIEAVGTAIEATMISQATIAATLEGMETTITYIHLRLGCGAMNRLWLTLKKTIALAEVVGLPRAANSARRAKKHESQYQAVNERIVSLWDTICVTERMAATMLNLPSATIMYRRPPDELTLSGGINSQVYLFRLSEIAMQAQDLDECYANGEAPSDIYPRILKADAEVRHLGRQTPPGWWDFDSQNVYIRHLLQLWHHYFLARIHIVPAISAISERDCFAYNRMSCFEACWELATRYKALRRLLPVGFYLARALDVQVVTAAVFLLLTCFDSWHGPDTQPRMLIVEEVLQAMDSVVGQPGADFAGEAAATIRSLRALLEDPTSGASSQSLVLRVPLLGTVRVTREEALAAAPQVALLAVAGCTDAAVDISLPVADSDPEQTPSSWSMHFDASYPFPDLEMLAGWEPWIECADGGNVS